MQRTRMWVNFSKEYSKEYEKCLKEKNFSGLVCKLLREYYNNEKTIDDKLDEMFNLIKNMSENNIEVDIKDDEDFSVW